MSLSLGVMIWPLGSWLTKGVGAAISINLPLLMSMNKNVFYISTFTQSELKSLSDDPIFVFLVISSLATSLACDPSDLPRGTRVTAHGPVLKVICEPGLQAFEMTPASISTSTADDKNRLLPTPTKRKFARFICMYGTTYQRINPEGVDPTLFFCAGEWNLLLKRKISAWNVFMRS